MLYICTHLPDALVAVSKTKTLLLEGCWVLFKLRILLAGVSTENSLLSGDSEC